MQRTASEMDLMTLNEAERLLDLSRQARWAFPTSLGRPVHWDRTEEWVEKLNRERDSFLKAAVFLMENGREDAAVEIAANVWRLWVLAKQDENGRRLLSQVLDRGTGWPTRSRALALYGDSLLAFRQGKMDESKKRSGESFRIAEMVNDTEALVLANLALSRVAMEDGDHEEAMSRASEARRLAGSLDVPYGQAPLFMEAMSHRMLGEYDKAASLFSESLALNRKLGDRGMVFAELNNLSFVEIHRDNVDVAERLFEESERLVGGKHDDPYGRGMTYLNKAAIAYRRGRSSEAQSLLETAKTTFAEAKMEPAKDDQSEFDWLERELKSTGSV